METLIQDIRFGIRMMLKSPGFTIVAVLSLALGIGANTAIFSVVNTVLLRPLPYKNPEQLVEVWQTAPKIDEQRLETSAAEYLDYRDRSQVFQIVAGFDHKELNLTGDRTPERIKACRVSANLFSLLGVAPLLGRTFSSEEDESGGPNVTLLGYSIWKHRYDADPAVLGKAVRLDDQLYTVIGVMPPSFGFPLDETSLSEHSELWIPLALSKQEIQDRAGSFNVGVIARLKPKVTIEQARSNVEAVAAAFQKEHSDIYSGNIQVAAHVTRFGSNVVARVQPVLMLLMGAVVFVLLIACANVANLLLTRAAARGSEIAVRNALGASPARLVRQSLTESVLLAILGGSLGLILACWAVDIMVRVGPKEVPRLQDVRIDPVVLTFTLGVSILSGLIFGIAPGLRISRLNISLSLKETGRQTSEGHRQNRLRSLLVVFETASALLLLLCAGLLVNSFERVLRVPPGFNPNGLLIARTAFDPVRYSDPGRRRAVTVELIRRLAGLPGVLAAGAATYLPLTDSWQIGFLFEHGSPNEFHLADNDLVSNDYFRALGIPLLRGRSFTDYDHADSPLVAVINEAMARQYWPGQDPIGQRIIWGGRFPFTVVGVVGDVKVSALDAATKPAVYMSMFQVQSGRSINAMFAIRAAQESSEFVPAVRREVWAVDKDLPVYDVRTMHEVIGESVGERRFSMLLLTCFAALALLISAVGLYSVISHSVAQRTHEIGIHMALGASPGDMLKLVLRQALTLTAIGIAFGLGGALVMTRFLRSMLFAIAPTDPTTFAGVSVVLALVALLASSVPARRATKVDPMVALRYE